MRNVKNVKIVKIVEIVKIVKIVKIVNPHDIVISSNARLLDQILTHIHKCHMTDIRVENIGDRIAILKYDPSYNPLFGASARVAWILHPPKKQNIPPPQILLFIFIPQIFEFFGVLDVTDTDAVLPATAVLARGALGLKMPMPWDKFTSVVSVGGGGVQLENLRNKQQNAK